MSEHVKLEGEYLAAAIELRAIAVEKKDLVITVRARARRFDAGLAAANLRR